MIQLYNWRTGSKFPVSSSGPGTRTLSSSFSWKPGATRRRNVHCGLTDGAVSALSPL
jgi:hypothetical protein